MSLFSPCLDIFDLLWPRACLLCRVPIRKGQICRGCSPPAPQFDLASQCQRCGLTNSDLDANGLCEICYYTPLPFGEVRALWRYELSPRRLITTMKYRPSPALCKIAGLTLASSINLMSLKGEWNFILPLPARPKTLRQRGFSQCLTLAKEIQRVLPFCCPIEFDALRANNHALPQASLPHHKRIKNASKSFMPGKHSPKGARILLVDDVITTGATAAAAAELLLKEGAEGVDLVALARANCWSEYRAQVAKAFYPKRCTTACLRIPKPFCVKIDSG